MPRPGKPEEEWDEEMRKKYPKYSKFFAGWWRPMVWLRQVDLIKLILKTSEPKAMSGGGGYALLKPWLGDGLLLSSGQKWFRHRRLLTPGFHFEVLRPYMAVYNESVGQLIEKWDKEGAGGSSVEIYKAVSLCTLDVMLRCAFSFESDVQSSDNKYVNTVHSLAHLLKERSRKPWMNLDMLYYCSQSGRKFQAHCEYAHKVADELIKSRQKLLQAKPDLNLKKYVDFLDILLLAKDEKGEGLTTEEIRHEVDTFLFEGHDTTASAISWILYALATHPEIQTRCWEEVKSIIEDPYKPYFDWNGLQKIPYLTQCIKEGLRLYSPVPRMMRELTKPLNLDDHILPPGTQIIGRVFFIMLQKIFATYCIPAVFVHLFFYAFHLFASFLANSIFSKPTN